MKKLCEYEVKRTNTKVVARIQLISFRNLVFESLIEGLETITLNVTADPLQDESETRKKAIQGAFDDPVGATFLLFTFFCALLPLQYVRLKATL